MVKNFAADIIVWEVEVEELLLLGIRWEPVRSIHALVMVVRHSLPVAKPQAEDPAAPDHYNLP